MIEKHWRLVGPYAFVAAGTSTGKVQLAAEQACHFRVKMRVRISNGPILLELEIKRINSDTELELGYPGKITDRADLSSFPIGSLILALEQPRNDIPLQHIQRAVYEEEPAVAIRNINVDDCGDPYSVDNPFPVQLSDGSITIENLNANVAVQLTAKDNDPKPGDVHDSVRIGDGTYELKINPDGSISVVVSGVTAPTIQNISASLANTEYNVVLPANTRRFIIRSRSGNSRIQFSYVAGQTNIDYLTIRPGSNYEESEILLASSTSLYFTCNKPNEIVEVVSWV